MALQHGHTMSSVVLKVVLYPSTDLWLSNTLYNVKTSKDKADLKAVAWFSKLFMNDCAASLLMLKPGVLGSASVG